MCLFLVALRLQPKVPDHFNFTQHEDYAHTDLDFKYDNFLNIRRGLPGYPALKLNGGAFSDWNATILQITFCTFINCGDRFLSTYTSGGAVYVYNVPNVTVVNTTVRDCFADGGGGAFYFATAPRAALFDGSTFHNCTVFNSSGGAIVAAAGGNVTVRLCTFDRCRADVSGGAIVFIGKGLLTVTQSYFNASVARVAGSIYISGGSFELRRTEFNNNSLVITNATGSIIDGDFAIDPLVQPSLLLVGTTAGLELMGCCFWTLGDSHPQDGLHIYSTVVGNVTFARPMCFDYAKAVSIYFKGQDPAKGMDDIFECTDCQYITATTQPATPTKSRTKPATPTQSASPRESPLATSEATSVATSSPSDTASLSDTQTVSEAPGGKSGWTKDEIIIWSVAGSVLLLLIIIVIVLVVVVWKKRRAFHGENLMSPDLGTVDQFT
jgi:hypothetical protein